MSDDHQKDSLIGRSLNGYKITGFIARGGMGEVYSGIQESLDRPVAIKILSPRFSAIADFQQRFGREARVASRLDHQNAVRILDFGVIDTIYYMVLELIEGENLRETLGRFREQGERMPLEQAVDITCQVGSALGAAHELGFIHRDIKPGNVLFRRNGQPVLADFGVVKVLETSDLTTPGTIFGVPQYKAPEEYQDIDVVGPATDQYSLAVMAYEMIAGQPPFDASTASAMMLKHVTEPVPPPSTIVEALPAQLDAVLIRALAKHPEDRYPSVESFVEYLVEAAQADPGPVEAPSPTALPVERPATPPERSAARDQPEKSGGFSSVAIVVGIFVVALIGGFGVILLLFLLLR